MVLLYIFISKPVSHVVNILLKIVYGSLHYLPEKVSS